MSLNYINTFIDSTATLLEKAEKRNFELYPILGNYVWPNYFVGDTYESEINYLKNWITNRLAWMDSEINLYEELSSESEMSLYTSEVNIFPNPFTDYLIFNIELSNVSEIMLNVSNSIGQIVYTKSWQGNTGKNEYRLDNLNNRFDKGIYFFRFTTNNSRVRISKGIKL